MHSVRGTLVKVEFTVDAGVCKACFTNENMAKHGRMGEYREQFVKDLDPASPGWPATLGDLSARLKTWRATLQSTVEDSMPPYLRLEDEARMLQVGRFCRPPRLERPFIKLSG